MAESEEASKRTGDSKLDRLLKKYAVFRIAKFAVATGTGFLVNELILFAGIFVAYHTTRVPSFADSSLTILGLDALALGTGATVAFAINERITVKVDRKEGQLNWIKRWGKYQVTSLTGNLIIIGVQLALLDAILLFPVYGSIIGAIVSYPVTYAVSMHFVWGVRPFRD